ncbi:MAG: tetratricopeptide repeat protein [Blastocatellia bacterium]|nr:tetratricopeptide repeat protein [Blastocatellia bacterium]
MKLVIRRTTWFLLLFLPLFITASVSTVFGCINEIGRSTVSEGIYVERLTPGEFLWELNTHKDKTYWKGVLRDLKHIDGRFSEIENRNNSAVALLHLGRITEAIRILQKIEQEKPGFYYTATNLGTAYELNGENAKALKWIQEGVARNKEAHNGSEWLHVRILEAKLALENDPNWLASNSVIGLHRIPNEQLLSGPVTTGNLGEQIDLKRVEEALIYQLHERLEFIKPPEGVVANLLFDLSRTLALTRGPEHATTIRDFAQTYGPDLMPWLGSDPSPHLTSIPPSASMITYWVAGGLVILLLGAVSVFALLRRRRVTE